MTELQQVKDELAEIKGMLSALLKQNPSFSGPAPGKAKDGQEYLTLKQAADESPYSLASLRRWIVYERLVKFSQPGGRGGTVSIKRSELHRLLKIKQKHGVSPRKQAGRKRQEPELYI